MFMVAEINIFIYLLIYLAEAVIGLLIVFLFRRQDFCYGHMMSQ